MMYRGGCGGVKENAQLPLQRQKDVCSCSSAAEEILFELQPTEDLQECRGSASRNGSRTLPPACPPHVIRLALTPASPHRRSYRVKFWMRARAFGNTTPSPRVNVNHRFIELPARRRDWPDRRFCLTRRQSLACRVIAAAAAITLQQALVPVFLGNLEGPENITASTKTRGSRARFGALSSIFTMMKTTLIRTWCFKTGGSVDG